MRLRNSVISASGNYRIAQAHKRNKVDRKSTRLNSSHLGISYAVFCLKKKKTRNKFSVEVIPVADSRSGLPNGGEGGNKKVVNCGDTEEVVAEIDGSCRENED